MKNLYCLFYFMMSTLCCTAQLTSRLSHIDNFPCEETRAVVVDEKGFVWVGTRLGLVRYDGFESILFHNNLQHPRTFTSCDIRCMCMGQNDDLWLGTFDGVSRFNTRTLSVRNYRLPHINFVDSIQCEKDGSILAKNSDGVFCYDAKKDCFVPSLRKVSSRMGDTAMQNFFQGQNITGSTTDRFDNTWVTIDNGGLWRMNSSSIVVERVPLNFTATFMPLVAQFCIKRAEVLQQIYDWHGINSLVELNDGTLLAALEQSGLQGKGKNLHFLSTIGNSAIGSMPTFGLASLDSTHLLVSTLSHIYIVDMNGSVRVIDRIGGKELRGLVLSINIMSSNDIWLGMVGGAVHITGNILQPERCNMQRYDRVGDYPIGGIFTILQDRHGIVWLCSSEPSLMCYDAMGDSLRSVSQDYAIRNDNVHDMAMTQDGSLWFTTNYGLLSLDFDDEGKLLEEHFYTVRDGLPASYLGSSNISALDDGRLCLIGPFGACLISVQKKKNQITERRGGKANFADLVWLTDTIYAGKSEMTFPHDIGELSFHLSHLHYGSEHAQRFRYQLLGWDPAPRETAMGTNAVTYTNLQPGTYIFEYEGGRFTIHILQPLWWRWWARLLYLFVVLVVIVCTVYVVQRQYRLKSRMRRMRIEHDLYTHITHQLMAPLDVIIDTVEELKRKVPASVGTDMVVLSAQTDRLKNIVVETVQARSDAMVGSETEMQTRSEAVRKKVNNMTDVDKDFLRRCRESVTRHLAEPDYSHRVMMEEVGASHSTLYRKLKSLTGMDTATFVREVRINAACQLLSRNPKLRISEVASMVGYTNPKYFSTHFKAVTGATPQQFKRS